MWLSCLRSNLKRCNEDRKCVFEIHEMSGISAISRTSRSRCGDLIRTVQSFSRKSMQRSITSLPRSRRNHSSGIASIP